MIPILYKKGASNFANNGIGHLKDAVSCKVTEERHGDYLLNLQYPISGAWYSEIVEGSIIKAKANETSELQLFRVYKSSKPMNGIVTFYAEHISYDLKGLPLCALSMNDTTPGAALTAGFAASVLPHSFTVWSDISSFNNINITKPRSLRNFCGGEAGSVLSVWGGEFEFDNFVVKLHKHRGANNGVVINYGKNLTDAKQERNISDCYTHFCPYAIKKSDTTNEAGEVIESTEETITLTEGVIELIDPENIGHLRALTLDISDKFADGEEMNEANLRIHAEEYIASHKLGVPKVNITLSFMQIWDSPEYSKIAVHERVSLCDTVTVRFSDLGIDAEAKVIKTEYDTLEERFSKIEVGDAKSTLADTVTSIEESINDTKKNLTESEKAASIALQSAIENATNRITGNSGGSVVLSPANHPQEILIMDSDKKETATRIWRWNSSGFGHSKNGYNGPFGLAITMDGAIVADYITAGTLKAINISGCTITGGSLNINDKFTVDTEGNARTEGYVVATGGIIGGCEIKDGKLQIPAVQITGTLTIGQLPKNVAKTSDIPNETQITTITKNTISTTDILAQNLRVRAVRIDGKLTADQIEVTDLRAFGATIGGFKIDNNSIHSQIGTDDRILLCSGTSASYTVGEFTSTGWSILAGKNFGVLKDGTAYMRNANISGTITANYGSVGGWDIDNNGCLWSGSNIEEADILLQPKGESYSYSVAGTMRDDWRLKVGNGYAVASTGELYCVAGYFRHGTKDVREVKLLNGKIQIKSKSDQSGNYTRYPLLEFYDGSTLCTLVARKINNTWDLCVITDKTADDFVTTV